MLRIFVLLLSLWKDFFPYEIMASPKIFLFVNNIHFTCYFGHACHVSVSMS